MSSAQPTNRGRRFLLWSFGVIVAFSLTLGIVVTQLFRLDRTDAKVRDEFIHSIDTPVHRQFQVNLGPTVLIPARFFIRFIDDVPPEAHVALSAARRASIGVYSIDPIGGPFDANALFEATSGVMPADKWNLVAAVRDGNETVMVYLGRAWTPGREIRVCIAVCDGQELVLVSAKVRPEPLMELASRNLPGFFPEG